MENRTIFNHIQCLLLPLVIFFLLLVIKLDPSLDINFSFQIFCSYRNPSKKQQHSMYKSNWNTLTSLIFILLLVPCFFTLVSCYDKNKENNLFDEGPSGAALALDEIDPGKCCRA